jgi:hypothetical protein
MSVVTMTLHQAQLAQNGMLHLPMNGVSPMYRASANSNGEAMQRKRSRDQAFTDAPTDAPTDTQPPCFPTNESFCSSATSLVEAPSSLVRTRKRTGQITSDAQRQQQSTSTIQLLLQAARRKEGPDERCIQAICATCSQQPVSLLECAGCATIVCRTCSMTLYRNGDSFDACFECTQRCN